MALAVVAIPSVALVTVGVVKVHFTVHVTPFLSAMIAFANLGIFEMRTSSV